MRKLRPQKNNYKCIFGAKKVCNANLLHTSRREKITIERLIVKKTDNETTCYAICSPTTLIQTHHLFFMDGESVQTKCIELNSILNSYDFCFYFDNYTIGVPKLRRYGLKYAYLLSVWYDHCSFWLQALSWKVNLKINKSKRSKDEPTYEDYIGNSTPIGHLDGDNLDAFFKRRDDIGIFEEDFIRIKANWPSLFSVQGVINLFIIIFIILSIWAKRRIHLDLQH